MENTQLKAELKKLRGDMTRLKKKIRTPVNEYYYESMLNKLGYLQQKETELLEKINAQPKRIWE